MMSGAVLTNHPRPVKGKNHRQFLQAYVVENLVISPLEEGGINGNYRLFPSPGEPCRHGYCMLFCDPNINKPVWKRPGKINQACPFRHSGCNCHHTMVFFGQFYQAFSKYPGISQLPGTLSQAAGGNFKTGYSMIFGGIIFRGQVAFSLLGHNMNKNRPAVS